MQQHLRTSFCTVYLQELYDVNCVHNCPASLVMVLQVVQASRWAPSTYSMAAVRVCELALQLVDLFVTKWIEIGCEGKDRKCNTFFHTKKFTCFQSKSQRYIYSEIYVKRVIGIVNQN